MNKDEIIRMAREAGARAQQNKNCDVEYLFSVEQIERLLAAEREACAKVCDTYEEWCGPWGQDNNLYAATESANEIAKAIRARGQS